MWNGQVAKEKEHITPLPHFFPTLAHTTEKPNLYFNAINFINDFKLLVRKTFN